MAVASEAGETSSKISLDCGCTDFFIPSRTSDITAMKKALTFKCVSCDTRCCRAVCLYKARCDVCQELMCTSCIRRVWMEESSQEICMACVENIRTECGDDYLEVDGE